MGAIQSLKAWWQGIVSKDDLDAWDGQPSPEYAREEAKALKKLRAELRVFVLATFSFLGSEVAERISRRVHKAARSEHGEVMEPACALRDGLMGDFFGGKRIPFVFLFEARYTENAEIILGKVCGAYGIGDRFQYDESVEGAIPLKVLRQFKNWLIERSFDLIIFDTGGDEYCGFLVPLTDCKETISRLSAMEIQATSEPEEA